MTARVRFVRGALTVAGALAGLAAVGPIGGAAAAGSPVPNACTLLPATRITAATGKAPGALHAKESSQQADGGTIHKCTYRDGSVTLGISVTPIADADNGYGGLPGLKIVKEPSLGPKGVLLYDREAKYQFASVAFDAGPYAFLLFSRGIATGKVLAAAHYLHANP